MKNNILKRAWLLIPAMILVSILAAMMPSSRAFAGNVSLNASKLNLYTNGGRKSFYLQVYDGDQPVKASFRSSKKKVASVSAAGTVKAKRKGTATIYATYGGVTYSCHVKVRKTSKTYKKCIKAYNRFLMNPYVLYTESGKTDQADNFYSLDLDKNGIPELLVNVVDPSNGGRYYVLYRFERGRISTGQIMGVCGDFFWYPSKSVMHFTKYESDRTLFIYSQDNGISLNTFAIMRRTNNKDTYYESDGSVGTLGKKISATDFHYLVDHDVLNYAAPQQVILHVNTPANRARYLK